MDRLWIILFFSCFIIIEVSSAVIDNTKRSIYDRCEEAVEQIKDEDEETSVVETPDRLYGTWLSKECETRAGPEYILRKYKFFSNGTFYLLRFHFADDSCAIATHTVAARGVIRFPSTPPPSSENELTCGASWTDYQLHHVAVFPFEKEIARHFSKRVNASCGPHPRWKIYKPYTVFESSPFLVSNIPWDTSAIRSINCLEPLGIDFSELALVKVMKKSLTSNAFELGTRNVPRTELFLGNLPSNSYTIHYHKPTNIQVTGLLRLDSIDGCQVCEHIKNCRQDHMPILIVSPPLPVVLEGTWISSSCESYKNNIWIKRSFIFHAPTLAWSGRWDYYTDFKCEHNHYTMSASGKYMQSKRKIKYNIYRAYLTEDFDQYSVNNNDPISSSDTAVVSSDNIFHKFEDILSNNIKSKRDVYESKYLEAWMTPELKRKIDSVFYNREEQPKSNQASFSNLKNIKSQIESEIVKNNQLIAQPKFYTANGDDNDDDDDAFKYLRTSQPLLSDSFRSILRSTKDNYEIVSDQDIPRGLSNLYLYVHNTQYKIPRNSSIAKRCNARILKYGKVILENWPKDCVDNVLESPSILNLKAKVSINWSGQWILSLGERTDDIWDAPLRKCGEKSPNPLNIDHIFEPFVEHPKPESNIYSSSTTIYSQFSFFIPLFVLIFYKFHSILFY